jgi:integrase
LVRSKRHSSIAEDVKNLLGHSSIVLTSNTYGHVLEQRQREVAMGMDAVLGG